MKKFIKIIGILLLVIVIGVGLFMGSIYVINQSKLKSEASKIEQYGESVQVNGKSMRVSIQGEGPRTFVLLPGYLTGSPVLDYTSLTQELSKTNRVVIVEPFGYGLSDDTDAMRSVENLVEEVHSALSQLEINRYTLVTHSIWGVYALQYIDTYPDEVVSYVGLDSSLPSQGGAEDNQGDVISFLSKSGLYRFMSGSNESFLNTPPIDSKLKEQFKYVSLKNIGSKASLNEGKAMPENFKKTMNLNYPKDLPVIYILASDSVNDDPKWLPIHEAMIENVDHGELIVLEGSHYIHHTQYPKITEILNASLEK